MVRAHLPTSSPFPRLATALIVGGGLLLIELLVAFSHHRRSTDLARANLDEAADAATLALEAHFDAVKEYLELMQEDLSLVEMSPATFEHRASAFVRSHPEVGFIAYADASLRYRWVVPKSDVTEPMIGMPVTIRQEEEPARLAIAVNRLVSGAPYVTMLGKMATALATPVMDDHALRGLLLAVVNIDGAMARIPTWITTKFIVTLRAEDGRELQRGAGQGSDGTSGDRVERFLPLRGSNLTLQLEDRSPPVSWGLGFLAPAAAVAMFLILVLGTWQQRKQRSTSANVLSEASGFHGRSPESVPWGVQGRQVNRQIRTLISAVLGYAEMLRLSNRLGAAEREVTGALSRCGRKLLALIDGASAEGASSHLGLSPPSGGAGQRQHGALAGQRVLIVEERTEAISLAEELLSGQGARVWVAATESEVLTLASHLAFDCALIDLDRARIDGPALIRRLRVECGVARILAQSTPQHGTATLDLSTLAADSVLLKPFGAVDFMAAWSGHRPKGQSEAILGAVASLEGRFRAGLAERLAAIDEAARARDWRQVALLCHRLSGAARGYGLSRVAAAAANVEATATSSEPPVTVEVELVRLRSAALSESQ